MLSLGFANFSWTGDPAGLFSAARNPSTEGGWQTISDDDGAVYDVITDPKVRSVPRL
jgi:hypothetical protein